MFKHKTVRLNLKFYASIQTYYDSSTLLYYIDQFLLLNKLIHNKYNTRVDVQTAMIFKTTL